MVDTPRSFSPFGHQSRVFEKAKMAGDRGTTDWQGSSEFAHREVIFAEQLQDFPASGIAESLERIDLW
jgi:hypothetical protein